MPLMRALWLHYPDDPIARGMGSEYLWGRDLLIAPVFEKSAMSREVYLPAGQWYDWWTSQAVPLPAPGPASAPDRTSMQPPDRTSMQPSARSTAGVTIRRAVDLSIMPIYVRAGAIIPVDPLRQYTVQPVTTPTTLRIYPGADGDFTLYDDDGSSQQYLHGKATWIRMRWNDDTRTLTLGPGAPAGQTSQPIHRRFLLRLMTRPVSAAKIITYDGKKIAIHL
jgi:alpha-glucosidase/alpha-D-xyloside xylohydrolase